MTFSSSSFRQLSGGDGTVLGQSPTDIIGFYGVTTVVPRVNVVGTNTAVMSAQSVSGIGSTFGFSTAAQFNMVVSTMTALFNLGLVG